MQLIEAWTSVAPPPALLTVSQWADEKRVLPQTSAARGARWRTDEVPYMRGVMDAVHEPGVQKIAIKKAAQIAGSEGMHNILGYFIEHEPCPILLIHPTIEVAEEWSKDRLKDMILSTPALYAVLGDSGTLLYKTFPNGFLAVGGANSENSFARRSVRLALGDDVDRWPSVVGEEGDPAELLFNRTTTFDDPLGVYISTPTLVGARIDALYSRSDQRRYFVCCPSCHRWDWITWSDGKHFRVTWEDRDPHTARLACPDQEHGGCGVQLLEPDRRAMIGMGQWRPTATAAEPGLVGFHLPAMLSTFRAVTLPYLVASFLGAHAAGKEAVRVFVNQKLGEGWEDRTAKMDPQGLLSRRESYGEAVEVPAAAVAITAGVDVQENRFEIQVIAWGLAEERWVIDVAAVTGDPKLASTQEELIRQLSRKYTHATGALLPIHAACIDTGYATDELYRLVLKHQSARRIYATKGVDGKAGDGAMILPPSEKRRGKGRESGVGARPVRLYLVNTDVAKSNVMSALAQKLPGPAYYHLPDHLDTVNEEFVAQLCAEEKVPVKGRHGVITGEVWIKRRERNEGLDTAVLALAAYRIFNPNIRQMLAALPVPGAPAAEAKPAPASKRSRTIGTMNYGGSP